MEQRGRGSPISLFKIVYQSNPLIFIFYLLLYLARSVTPLLQIIVYSQFINSIVAFFAGQGSQAEIANTVPYLLGLGLLNLSVNSLMNVVSTRFQLDLALHLRMEVSNKISRLKYPYIESSDSYELSRRVRAGTARAYTGLKSILTLIELVLRVVWILISAFVFLRWQAGLLILLFIPMVWVSLRRGEENYEAFVKFQKIQNRLNSYDTLLTSRDFAAERELFGFHERIAKRWQLGSKEASNILLNVKSKMYLHMKASNLLILASSLLMIFILLMGVVNGQVSVGHFTTLTNQLIAISTGLSWALAGNVHSVVETLAYAKDFHALFALEEEKLFYNTSLEGEDVQGIHPLLDSKEEKRAELIVEFKNLSFSYPNSENLVLEGLNLKLDFSKNYAIVGENGAGKTTLIKILLGLFDDYSGEILLNGQNLKDIENPSALFSIAFQDFAKYQISIRENILFAKDKSKDKKIIECLSLLDFPIKNSSRFPKGLDTDLGYLTEENTNLSLGQWQKLILVRALAQGGEVFILDEPTASLDPVAEASIYKDFMSVIQQHPSLIITHRLGAARLADEIIVLGNGSVLEQGSHEALIEAKGVYAEMFSAQKGWYVA